MDEYEYSQLVDFMTLHHSFCKTSDDVDHRCLGYPAPEGPG